MQCSNDTEMMDTACQTPLPSLILASPPTVLPHESTESTQLADQASHLTLATSSGRADASSLTGPHDDSGVTSSYGSSSSLLRSRNRACSACSSAAASDVHVNNGPRPSPPLPQQCEQASPSSIERSPSRPATEVNVCLPNDAQPAPLISHEHAREGTRMTAAAELKGERHCMQPADALPLALLRKHSPSRSSPDRKVGKDAPTATLTDLPNEVLLHILGYLDVCDLLLLSRVSYERVVMVFLLPFSFDPAPHCAPLIFIFNFVFVFCSGSLACEFQAIVRHASNGTAAQPQRLSPLPSHHKDATPQQYTA